MASPPKAKHRTIKVAPKPLVTSVIEDLRPTLDNQSVAQQADTSTNRILARIANCWCWIVLLLVCWQPLELGFYLDDWAVQAKSARYGDAFSGQRFRHVMEVDQSRPGVAVIRYALSSVLGDRPVLWQLAMLLSNGLVAFCLARAALAICGEQQRETNRGALGLGLSWLLLPWSTSSQFWTVLLPVTLLLALFGYLIARVVQRESPTIAASVIDGLIYLWICISYEAFYGQFVAVVLLIVGLAVFGRMRPRAAVLAFLSFGTAQVLAVCWYFASGKVTTAQRPVNHGWTALFIHNLLRVPIEMIWSATELRWVFSVSLLALVCCAAWILWKARQQWTARKQVLGSILIVLACLFGAVLSVVSFSLGAHPVAGRGVENRDFVLLSFWLVLFAGIAAITVLRFGEARWRPILAMVALVFGVILGVAHTIRTMDWATAWTQQQQILHDAPVERLLAAEADSAIVLVSPLWVNGAPIFGASYDINSALPLSYRVLEKRWITIYNYWNGPMVWDGNRLSYAGQAPLATTRNVYVWIPADYSFRRAERPFRISQDLHVSDLP